MEIFGTGIDIININRIKLIIKKKKLFKKRIFSKKEIIYCEKKKNKDSFYAKRFAAKEAFSKALGVGISQGLCFNEIEIQNNAKGKPVINILGKSRKIVEEIINKKKFKIFLSLSDEISFAIALVIIEI